MKHGSKWLIRDVGEFPVFRVFYQNWRWKPSFRSVLNDQKNRSWRGTSFHVKADTSAVICDKLQQWWPGATSYYSCFLCHQLCFKNF
ncbi:hypothetical protein NC652_030960 [Populus alba x Populus x berolinensis]|nr:hypothetical protein NC652_030960 [Populus alba x Populus x berolinensis]